MYTVDFARSFDRAAKSFFRKHPDLKEPFADLVVDLRHDPKQPHLRLHARTGKLSGYHAVRLTYAVRVVLVLKVVEGSIELIDIGTHDEVYRRGT